MEPDALGARRRPAIGRGAGVAVLCSLSLHLLNPPRVLILPEPNPPVFPRPREMPPPEVDIRLLEVTTRKGWETRRSVATYEELRTDRRLWATMFFRDWDRVPDPLREEGLARMLARFWGLMDRPRSWLRMTPEDWDQVPQPIRAMAFMNMVARWEACYLVAGRFGLDRAQVVSRLRALAMAESWFEHRAVNENTDGTSDLGLAQATTATRERLRWRAAAGLTDFRFEDEEYFDPLKASRVLVYWFALMLDETRGDLELATRAYHVGSERARAGQGADYLDRVLSVEGRFMDGAAHSRSWRFLRSRSPKARLAAPGPEAPAPCPSGESP